MKQLLLVLFLTLTPAAYLTAATVKGWVKDAQTGEPLCRYVLDHYVYGISVDEQKGIILATDVNKDDPIIEYSMK